jgi:hypothetical protein
MADKPTTEELVDKGLAQQRRIAELEALVAELRGQVALAEVRTANLADKAIEAITREHVAGAKSHGVELRVDLLERLAGELVKAGVELTNKPQQRWEAHDWERFRFALKMALDAGLGAS